MKVEKTSNDYIKLFVRREGKVVFGKKYSNLWLLTAVLSLTFMAIAFSNASLNYLKYKMDDPFINWLSIENENDTADYFGLSSALTEDSVKQYFHIQGIQEDYKYSINFIGNNEEVRYFTGRFFQELNTPLVQAILEGTNVVGKQCVSEVLNIDESSVGIIMTENALTLMGYKKAPAFVNYARYCPKADTLGFNLYTSEKYTKVPLPVLGVVKKLPGNVDFISSAYFLEQDFNDYTNPFYLADPKYAHSIHYFLPTPIESQIFAQVVEECSNQANIPVEIDELSFYLPQINTFKPGRFVSLLFDEDVSYHEVQDFDRLILSQSNFVGTDLTRVYEYDFSFSELAHKSFVSVNFSDLEQVKAFETFSKEEYGVEIEMSQINAKDNFNAVSIMANILSWAIIGFSIICIVLFVINLLQSYFQKVRKNLGTFKAFGISNKELIGVYMLIMLATILCALLVSLLFTYLVQLALPIFGAVKEGTFSYLSLWNAKTYCSIIIVVLCSLSTVYFVMKRLLEATPGDLIYDRE